jgi:hypothetical protein
MLPSFTSEGLLPPGNYDLTIELLKNSILVAGPPEGYPNWDARWRMRLVNSLEILAGQLWQVGIPDPICIGGSFVEDRYHPHDIDGYFYCYDEREFITGELQRKLNELDPHKAWNWSPKSRTHDARGKWQYPHCHRYSVDLFPNIGQPTGVFDDNGEPMNFYSLMRWSDRVKSNRGVIQLRRSL